MSQVASKSGHTPMSAEHIEELLDAVDSTLDRLKTLYEQYFLGIQKQAPGYIHSDVERKLRELTQLNIRNTGLRYRLATLQQKFGSYNSYWRRTMRQIENGTYTRNLAKIGREAARNGREIPEEILAAMPKRMREQVLRDREQALAIAKRRQQLEEDAERTAAEAAAVSTANEPQEPRDTKTSTGAHVIDESDADIDFNALFAAFEDDAPKLTPSTRSPRPATRPPRPVSRPPLPRMPVPPTRPPATGAGKPDGAMAQPSAVPPRTPTGGVPAVGAPPRTPTPAAGVPMTGARVPTPPAGVPTGASPRVPTPPAGVPVVVGPPRAPTPPAGVPVPMQTGNTHQIARVAVGPHPAASPKTGPVPVLAGPQTGPIPTVPRPPSEPAPPPPRPPTGPVPTPPRPRTGPVPAVPRPAADARTQPVPRMAPSQQSRPIPVAPGAAARTGPVPVASMSGPFSRAASENSGRVSARASTAGDASRPVPLEPPPGMTEADVNALHAKYVKAKQMIGEKVDPGSREKLLRTINQTAPKIMQQYKASAVDFSVVVKDNQVVIKAKPRT